MSKTMYGYLFKGAGEHNDEVLVIASDIAIAVPLAHEFAEKNTGRRRNKKKGHVKPLETFVRCIEVHPWVIIEGDNE